MPDDTLYSRGILALSIFVGCLVVGLGIGRYVAPPRWETGTIVGATSLGILFAGLAFRRRTAAYSQNKEKVRSGSPNNRLSSESRLGAASTKQLLLVVHLAPQEQLALSSEVLPPFMSSVKACLQHEDSYELSDRWLQSTQSPLSSPQNASSWLLRGGSEQALGQYIEIPVAIESSKADGQGLAIDLVRNTIYELGLAGTLVSWMERLRSVWTGSIPQSPRLKGVVLCCPANLLNKETTLAASLMRAITETLRCKFPLYVIVTGLETLKEFNDFVEFLSRSYQSVVAEPLGSSFLEPFRGRADIQRRLQEISATLASWRLVALREENKVLQEETSKQQSDALYEYSAQRKANIYEFPRQLRLLNDASAAFCWNVLQQASLTQSGPVLRGTFYTGLLFTHTGSAVVTGDIRQQEAQRVFLWRLLAGQLVDAREAGTEQKFSADSFRAYRELTKTSERAWRLTLGTALGAVILALIGASVSLIRNAADLVSARSLASQLSRSLNEHGSTPESLKSLDDVRQRVEELRRAPSVWSQLGFYQGHRIRTKLERQYFQAVPAVLLNPVLASLEQILASPSATSTLPLTRVDALRLYQMLHRREHCIVDERFVTEWGPRIWARDNAAGSAKPTDLARSQFVYLALSPHLAQVPGEKLRPWRQDLVARAQLEVARSRGFQQVYEEIIRAANLQRGELTEILSDEPERAAQLLKDHAASLQGDTSIDGAYTLKVFGTVRDGLRNWQQRLGLSECVAAGALPTQSPVGEQSQGPIRPAALYASEYKARWKEFLSKTRVKNFVLADAPTRLAILSSERSPLLGVLAFVSHHTDLNAAPRQPGAVPAADTDNQEAQTLLRAFAPVHKVALPGADRWAGGWWNEVYRRNLLELKDAMSSVVEQPSSKVARQTARGICARAITTIDLLQFPSGTDGTDRLVKDLLKAPFEITRSKLPEEGPREINAVLSGLCGELERIKRRFPSNDMEEIKRVFDPSTGSFLRLSTAGFVEPNPRGDGWQRGAQAEDLTLNPNFLPFLNRLTQVSRYLFVSGFTFTVEVTSTPADMPVNLMIGGAEGQRDASGKRLRYSWPGPTPAAGLVLTTPGASVEYAGLFGLYRMIQSNERDQVANRVGISKPKLPGGGVAELKHAGKPARVDLTFYDLPNGLEGPLGGLGCPASAALH